MYSWLIHGIKNEWKNIHKCVGLSLCHTYTIYEVMKKTNHSYDLNDAISEVYPVYAPQGRCAPDSMCPMVESCSPCVESLCPNHAPLHLCRGNQGADISFKWVKPSVIGLNHSNSMKCWHPGTLLPNIDIVEMSFLGVNLVRHIKSVYEWLKVILNFCSDISNVHMWWQGL